MVVGSRGTIDVNPRLLMLKEASVCGMLLSKSTSEEYKLMSSNITKLLSENSIRPIISNCFSLKELPQAHRHMTAHTGAHGCVVINMEDK